MSGEAKFSRVPARAAAMKLTATDWAVLHVICLHADKSGHAYPSLARIGAIARVLRNHVSRSTKRLEQLGLLRSRRVARGSGWASTRYEIVFDVDPDMAPLAGAPEAEVTPEMVAPEIGVAPELVTPPDRVAPEVVLGGTSSGTTGGTSDGALTYQSTDHRTDAYQGKEGRGESLSGAGAPSDGDTRLDDCVLGDQLAARPPLPPGKPDRPDSGVVLDPSTPCRRLIGGALGCRSCGRPSVRGTERCAEHALRVAAA